LTLILIFLKDERLKLGKNPRLINGCSLSTTIEFRRYFLDFVAAMQSNNFNCGVGIGMNIHGLDWSRLANKLLSVGDRICCGDYSGFGPGLDPELVLAAGEIIESWYSHNTVVTEEDKAVRRLLFEELAFSKEVSRREVIQTLCGSPSGNPLTVVVNSIVNLMYVMLVWLDVFEGTELDDLGNFWRECCVIVYGDDLVMSLSDRIKEFYNNETLQQKFALYGIKYTDADKGGSIRKYHGIEEATFLKCFFRKHDTRGLTYWLAALEKPMIEDITNWIRKSCPDMQEASLANCTDACRLAYAWGRDYHGSVCAKLQAYWRKNGFHFHPESWDYVDAMFFGEKKMISGGTVGDLYGLSRARIDLEGQSQVEHDKTECLKAMSGRYTPLDFNKFLGHLPIGQPLG